MKNACFSLLTGCALLLSCASVVTATQPTSQRNGMTQYFVTSREHCESLATELEAYSYEYRSIKGAKKDEPQGICRIIVIRL